MRELSGPLRLHGGKAAAAVANVSIGRIHGILRGRGDGRVSPETGAVAAKDGRGRSDRWHTAATRDGAGARNGANSKKALVCLRPPSRRNWARRPPQNSARNVGAGDCHDGDQSRGWTGNILGYCAVCRGASMPPSDRGRSWNSCGFCRDRGSRRGRPGICPRLAIIRGAPVRFGSTQGC